MSSPKEIPQALLDKHERLVNATAVANATPLPGPLAGAFDPRPLQVAGLTLVPVVAYHLTLLQLLDSPIFLAATLPEDKRAGMKVDHESVYEAIFLFTRPVAECRRLFKRGREVFREAALTEIADRLPAPQVPAIERAVMQHLVNAFSTAVGHQLAAGDDGTVFTPPPAEPTTGSAGG